jgi:hypothetical protein
MTKYNLIDENAIYMDVTRYWHPQSEKYAGGDALLTAIVDGWAVDDVVYREEFWHAGTRCTVVYHFELELGDEIRVMPMVVNPYVERFVAQMNFTVLPIEKRKLAVTESRNAHNR